jgi:hypothetical protein
LPQRVSHPAEPPSSCGVYDATHIEAVLLLKSRNCAGGGRIVLTILFDRNLCGRERALDALDIVSPHRRIGRLQQTRLTCGTLGPIEPSTNVVFIDRDPIARRRG